MSEALFTTVNILVGGMFLVLVGVVARLGRKIREVNRKVAQEKAESTRRLYELVILKEIGDRAGYSLNVEEILQIITGSLRQFLDYSAVSYIVITPEKIKLNTHLESMVGRKFINDMKERMLASLEALNDKPVDKNTIEEVVSGAISIDESPEEIGSFFNIPLVIGSSLSGILTVANIKKGLYKEEDMTILYKITSQASKAVSRLQEVVKIEEEKLMKVREEYMSMIVHELRSPLDGMKKIVELIVSGNIKYDSPKFSEYIQLLHQSSSSTLELVNDILDYSKMQAGKFELFPSVVNMKEILSNRISFYEVLANTRKLNLSLWCEGDVPEKISLDERAIKQVLNNFISNSLKFTFEGGKIYVIAFIFDPAKEFSNEMKEKIDSLPSPISEKDIKMDTKSVVVLVSDSGYGIPQDKQKELFLTYKQISGTNFSDARGTGLGLVIAKGIVDAHKGFIGLSSVDKVGSTFFFAIPMV